MTTLRKKVSIGPIFFLQASNPPCFRSSVSARSAAKDQAPGESNRREAIVEGEIEQLAAVGSPPRASRHRSFSRSLDHLVVPP
jgi:hypothetical protein